MKQHKQIAEQLGYYVRGDILVMIRDQLSYFLWNKSHNYFLRLGGLKNNLIYELKMID
jgi:hypothetical protein